jgi:hypothetical protein
MPVSLGESLQRFRVFLFGDFLLKKPHFILQDGQLLDAALHLLQQGLTLKGHGFLGKIPDMHAFANQDLPPVRMLLLRNHSEKGRLPGPVGADETDPVPGSEPKRGSGKKDLFPESFFQTYDFNQDKTLEIIFFPLYITTNFLKLYNIRREP